MLTEILARRSEQSPQYNLRYLRYNQDDVSVHIGPSCNREDAINSAWAQGAAIGAALETVRASSIW